MSGLFPPQQYAHLRLAQVGSQAPRRKQQARGVLPSRVPRVQGDRLNAAVQGILSARDTRRQVVGIDPALVLRVRLSARSQIDKETWARSGFTVIGSQPDNVTLLFANDLELEAFKARVSKYAVGPVGEKATQRYPWMAAIENVTEWGPDDRRGRTLRNLNVQESAELTLDVELWYPGSRERSDRLIQGLRQFVESQNGRVLDTYTGASIALARVRIPSLTFDELLALDSVYSVELPPKPSFSLSQMLKVAVSDFAIVQPPPVNASSICILDSGIAAGHSLLGPAVGETIAVPLSLGTATDVNGHGTMVGGIALYGNVQTCIENKSFEPEHWLFSARVTNNANAFDEYKLIPRQMQEAIEYFYTNHKCRVFNISLGDRNQPYDGGHISTWAATLDELARRLDVVIVVSSGNYVFLPDEGDADGKVAPWTDYPEYLFNDQARILSPSEAANVLTVGAITRPGAPIRSERYPTDVNLQTVAGPYEPSPFTRTGPGIQGAIKPELCEIGGNFAIDLRTGARSQIDSGIACVSLSREFVTGSLFAFDSGTSFAAPCVANAAAKVLDRYPDASANLVRALLASSASIPQETAALFQGNGSQIQKVCGYGRPDPAAAVISTDERVVLVAEEQLGADQFHIFEVPLPQQFLNITGMRHIGIALAFDPPTRDTRLDYIGTFMDFRLVRGLELKDVSRAFASRSAADVDDPALPSSTNCHMEPGAQARQWSTLQHATFSMKQNPKAHYGDMYYVVVRCKRGWAGDEYYPQKYALVVTLEHTRPGIQLYEAVRERMREVERVQLRNRG